MGYLDQLKNISNVPDAGPKEPKKPPESGCLGFLGSSYGVLKKIHALEASARWLLHFADREPLTVAFSPPSTHAAVLDVYPDALAAEPIEPGRQLPDTLLAGDQEAAVLAWLSEIGENDQATIDDMLRQCRQDEEARRYFLGRAVEISADDDRRCCSQCLNLRSGVCVVAKPGGVGSAIRGYRPALGILQH